MRAPAVLDYRRFSRFWARLLTLLPVLAGIAAGVPASYAAPDTPDGALLAPRSDLQPVTAGDGVPDQAKAVLQQIRKRDGKPPPGYVGGRVFENRERRLPRGRYREYDVHPKMPGRTRGPERIVIEQRTGKAYYTDDHYNSFIPMN